MDIAAAARRRKVLVGLAWSFWAVNLAVIVGFWLYGNVGSLTSGDTGLALVAIARLCGLVGTFCVLTQLVLMGRAGWLEPIFGLDRLAVFHRRNGMAALLIILLHPTLLAIGYSILSGLDVVAQYLALRELPYVDLASYALILLVITIGVSIYIVRKHLKFETWHAVHLFNYAVVLLVVWHQLKNGADFVGGGVFYWYWIALYVFAGLNILVWRWIKPFAQSWYHHFRVEKVVAETSTANSVYITGRRLHEQWAKGGQFVMVRFLTKRLWAQEHPFSLSKLPDAKGFRLTIRALGDFTNQMPTLKPGTKVIVSGPHGAYTHDKQATNKILYIAGGIGITPIRAMIEERAAWPEPGNAVLIYGNKTIGDSTLLAELDELGKKIHMPIHNVLSEQKDYKGEAGYVDGEKIKRLVPDVTKRDVFVCGPPPMMNSIIAELKSMGVPAGQIHYERFALHKG